MAFRPAIFALLFPCALQAQCPGASDLANGIRFAVDQSDSETFRDLGDGIVESIYTFGEGGGLRVLLAKGLYPVEFVDIEDGRLLPDTRATYTFPIPVGDMPLPAPGGGWDTEVTIFENGGFSTETQSYEFGQMGELTIRGCSYPMMRIEVTFAPDDGNSLDTLHYLPTLGISYLASSRYDGDEDRYIYHRIEAVE